MALTAATLAVIARAAAADVAGPAAAALLALAEKAEAAANDATVSEAACRCLLVRDSGGEAIGYVACGLHISTHFDHDHVAALVARDAEDF